MHGSGMIRTSEEFSVREEKMAENGRKWQKIKFNG
jgi:hypothetical protein